MNKDRRNQIEELARDLAGLAERRAEVAEKTEELVQLVAAKREEIKESLDRLSSEAGELETRAEKIGDEEQEFLDNMPEGLQQGERGQAAEAAISALDQAETYLRDLAEFELPEFELHVDEVTEALENIDNASASLEEAAA